MNHTMFCEFLKGIDPDDLNLLKDDFFKHDVMRAISSFPVVHVLGNAASNPANANRDIHAGMVQCVALLYALSKRTGEKPLCIEIERLVTDLGPELHEYVFGRDLEDSLKELRVCFVENCYISVMCLGGKILEICFKLQIQRSGKNLNDDSGERHKSINELGIGELIGYITRKCPDIHIDPGFMHLVEIINKNRIPAVHAKESIPIPSEDEAAMVIHAVLDVVKRTFSEVLKAEKTR